MYKNFCLYRRFEKFVLTVIFCLLAFCALCQQHYVKGRVQDAINLEPIPFAGVFIKSHPNLSILSDVNGNFSVEKRFLPDSAIVNAGGYQDQPIFLYPDTLSFIQIFLKQELFDLAEVVITAQKEDPAYQIIRKVISNKSNNNKNNLDYYQLENYRKLKFGIKNVDQQLKNRKLFKPFKFIFDNIDSTEEVPYLPVFFMESVSDIYYNKKINTQKEIVKAMKSSGVTNASVSSLFDDLSATFYIYDNYLPLFSKNFISPISDHCFSHYKYELVDSMFKEQYWTYKIKYWPKKKQELTFAGTLWICDSSFAVKEVSGNLSETANLNFITSLHFYQTYEQQLESSWQVVRDELVVNGAFFIPHEMRAQKFIAKKFSSSNNFKADDQKNNFFDDSNVKSFGNDAYSKSEADWKSLRHDSLTRNEIATYSLVDSIKTIPAFKNYLAIFTGYLNLGKIEIGPYYKIYSYNPVEGNRFRLGFRSNPKFSKNLLVDGYGAYGLRDQQMKYGFGVQYYFDKNPRSLLGASFKHDVEQLGFTQNNFRMQDNFLYTIFKIYPYNKLNRVNDARLFFEKEWLKEITTKVSLRRSLLMPAGKLIYQQNTSEGTIQKQQIETSEISLHSHFSLKEKFLYGEYNRLSLGSPFPTLDAMVTASSMKLGSDYSYQKLVISIQQHVDMKIWGHFKYRVESGKMWGTAPFPLLEMHSGNQTLFYDPTAFSTMNFFEFISDQYVSSFVAYHLDGLILNKIPLIRRLKWREVLTCNAVVGSLKESNRNALVLPENMFVPEKVYTEAGIGIENILRFLRLDAVWRLAYLEHPNVNHFVIKGSVQFDF